jgi:hypothetical protein
MTTAVVAPVAPDPYTLKHHVLYLIDYRHHDGFYPANDTDCLYISLGWAQYDAQELSVKTMRHTGEKWSRLSEELPLHRAIDATSLIATALETSSNSENTSICFPANFFENQPEPKEIQLEAKVGSERRNFNRVLGDELVRRRLGSLADVLIRLRQRDEI